MLVDRPDRLGRIEILAVHLRDVTASPDVDPEQVAALTPGFTGADLANLVNEAALVATRRDSGSVAMADFTTAIERIVAGLEKKNRLLNPCEREVVAHHEMGHALVAAALPTTDPVHKVSIIPRGIGALGYTLQRPTEDRYLMTRRELEQKLAYAENGAGLLGGPGTTLHSRRYSEETAREIDCAVRAIVDTAFDCARAVLDHNRTILEESARALLDRETLTEADLLPIFEKVELPDAALST